MANRLNCRHCRHFTQTDQGPRCRFRGGKPSGICSVFKRRPEPQARIVLGNR